MFSINTSNNGFMFELAVIRLYKNIIYIYIFFKHIHQLRLCNLIMYHFLILIKIKQLITIFHYLLYDIYIHIVLI